MLENSCDKPELSMISSIGTYTFGCTLGDRDGQKNHPKNKTNRDFACAIRIIDMGVCCYHVAIVRAFDDVRT